MIYLPHPKARSENLVIQTLAGETLVYDMTSNQAHCLNETAAFVWSRCTGEVSIDEIAGSVERRFGHIVNTDFVRLAVTQLNDRMLMSVSGLNGMTMPSRREAIKKLGVASVLALPIIASIVAPANAFGALSCRVACTSPSSCTIPACGNFCNGGGECAPFPVGPPVTITA